MMKKTFGVLILLGCGCGVSSLRAGGDTQASTAARLVDLDVPVFRIPHLQWLGFWGSALSGLPDAIDDTAGFTNLVHMRDDPGSATFDANMRRARANGQQVVLHVQNVFFAFASGHLVADPSGAWDAFLAAAAPYDDVVMGYYLFDEPFWNNDSIDGFDKVSDAELAQNLATAAALVKARRPGLPLLMTYAFPEVTPSLQLTPGVDWVALDCYRSYQLNGDCTDAKTVALLDELRGMLGPDQRLFITADAFFEIAPNESIENAVLQRIQLLERYTAEHPEVVAWLPFIYQSDASAGRYGATSMPRLLDWYRHFGRTLLGVEEPTPTSTACEGSDWVRRDGDGLEVGRWANAPPPYCPGPCFVDGSTTVGCEGHDYVRRDSCGGEVGRWANAPAPYCPACVPDGTTTVGCEGTDYVRRDSCGGEVGRWANAPPPYCP
jgi:hypothetical protein